jgi:hypothetical protein
MEQPQGLNGETVFAVKNARIGTVDGAPYGYASRLPVKLSVRVERIMRPGMTVEHERIGEHLDFAIVTSVWRPRASDIVSSSSGFQRPEGLNSSLSESQLSMLDVLDGYHLNTLTAACVHQQPQVDQLRADGHSGTLLDEVEYCERGDYHYGTAWLVRPLPSGMLNELRRIFSDVDPAVVYDSGEEE